MTFTTVVIQDYFNELFVFLTSRPRPNPILSIHTVLCPAESETHCIMIYKLIILTITINIVNNLVNENSIFKLLKSALGCIMINRRAFNERAK